MSKWTLSEEEFEKQYTEGVDAEEQAAVSEPRACAASVENGILTLSFVSGVSVGIPLGLVENLKEVPHYQLAGVEVVSNGEGLAWEQADMHLSVPGLMLDLFGSERLKKLVVSEQARRAAATTSAAKAEAARKNGKKGGRPRKSVAESLKQASRPGPST